MSEVQTLDIIAQEIIDSAKQLAWPEGKPEVKKSWVKVIRSEPNILGRLSDEYSSAVEGYLCAVDNLGFDMRKLGGR